jgi:hypothetical protein
VGPALSLLSPLSRSLSGMQVAEAATSSRYSGRQAVHSFTGWFSVQRCTEISGIFVLQKILPYTSAASLSCCSLPRGTHATRGLVKMSRVILLDHFPSHSQFASLKSHGWKYCSLIHWERITLLQLKKQAEKYKWTGSNQWPSLYLSMQAIHIIFY